MRCAENEAISVEGTFYDDEIKMNEEETFCNSNVIFIK